MNWDDTFAKHYTPVNRPDVQRCATHPGHAMLPSADGEFRCTSSLHLPKVRDDVDRIGDALKAEHWCAVVGCTHLTVTGHRFCIGHEAEEAEG